MIKPVFYRLIGLMAGIVVLLFAVGTTVVPGGYETAAPGQSTYEETGPSWGGHTEDSGGEHSSGTSASTTHPAMPSTPESPSEDGRDEGSPEGGEEGDKGHTGTGAGSGSSSATSTAPSAPSGSSGGSSQSTGRPAEPSKPDQPSPPSATPPTTAPTVPSTPPAVTPVGRYMVGYYAGWSSYSGYTPAKIPAGMLTHLHYAFAKIDPSTGKIALADAANDRKNFAAIRQLKQRYPSLKTLISVGGWDYSAYFSDVAATPSRRETFAQSCVDFILEHGFDGVDIDWEYPVSGGLAGNTNRPQDKQNFTLLLKAIRDKLDKQEARDGKTYYLSIAGAANTGYLSKIEPKAVAGVVDYIFLMAYDMHGPWDTYADFNAPLYMPEEQSPQYKNSVYDGIKAYISAGVSARKLVLGMPFYGYVYQGVKGQNNGLYSTFSSAKSVSYNTLRSTYLNNSAFKQYRHARAGVPYLYGSGTFVTYEDASSIAAKAAMAKSMGLAGAGAWELSQDTSGSLLKSAWQTLSR